MDYSLIEVIKGMELKLVTGIPADLEDRIIDVVESSQSDYMDHRVLAISLVESWIRKNVRHESTNQFCEDFEEMIDEYVGQWYDDWFEGLIR